MNKPPVKLYKDENTISIGIVVVLLLPLLFVISTRDTFIAFFTHYTVAAVLLSAVYISIGLGLIFYSRTAEPHITIHEEGIEQDVWYLWDDMTGFALQCKASNDTTNYFLLFEMTTGDNLVIDITDLDKTPKQIVTIIESYTKDKLKYIGYLLHKD